MDLNIASILAIDGLASGAIYVLIAIGTVLIFTVTRVVFIPFGDIAAFTALTLAALEVGKLPGTAGLVVVLAVIATLVELVSLLRNGRAHEIPSALLYYLVLPLVLVGAVWLSEPLYQSSMVLRILFALILIVPIAPLLDRIVYRPIADASVLMLLIVSMALHFALVGVGLLFFGPEGVRTEPMTDAIFEFGQIMITGQAALIMFAAILFSGLLYLFFDFTLTGKSLRATAVNRTGARLMGIRPERSGTIAYIVGRLWPACPAS
jgi:branched-chain amino acid transport system permease protein